MKQLPFKDFSNRASVYFAMVDTNNDVLNVRSLRPKADVVIISMQRYDAIRQHLLEDGATPEAVVALLGDEPLPAEAT